MKVGSKSSCTTSKSSCLGRPGTLVAVRLDLFISVFTAA